MTSSSPTPSLSLYAHCGLRHGIAVLAVNTANATESVALPAHDRRSVLALHADALTSRSFRGATLDTREEPADSTGPLLVPHYSAVFAVLDGVTPDPCLLR